MARFPVLAAALSLATLAGCNHIETSYRYAEGVTGTPKPSDSPVEILAGRPTRAFRSLGTVEVRVDRGTPLKNPTLADAIPSLSAQARAMGADAVMLTHEQFASWYDKGEDASPIHDLERQESWYITEKARYVTGVAIAYDGCGSGPVSATPPANVGAPRTVPGAPSAPLPSDVVPMPPPLVPTVPMPEPPPAPIPVAPPAAPELPPVPALEAPRVPVPEAPVVPSPEAPSVPTAPSLPEGPIDLPPAPAVPPAPEVPKLPELPPLPETPKAPELPPAPPQAPELPK